MLGICLLAALACGKNGQAPAGPVGPVNPVEPVEPDEEVVTGQRPFPARVNIQSEAARADQVLDDS